MGEAKQTKRKREREQENNEKRIRNRRKHSTRKRRKKTEGAIRRGAAAIVRKLTRRTVTLRPCDGRPVTRDSISDAMNIQCFLKEAHR